MQPSFADDDALDGLGSTQRHAVRSAAAIGQCLAPSLGKAHQPLVAALSTDGELLAQLADGESAAVGKRYKLLSLLRRRGVVPRHRPP